MKTYQDLLQISENEAERMKFVKSVIDDHKSSSLYKTADVATKYYKHRNVTIENYVKVLYKATGEAIPDKWSANYKMAGRHFYRFITQENQFLLGNGITWQNKDTAGKLGNKLYPFDNQLQTLGAEALIGAVSFGFFNIDHIEAFSVLEFAPLYDEIDGSLKAGVRFWQIDSTKPLRATLYELDGYTDYIWINKDMKISNDWRKVVDNQYEKPKRAYKLKIEMTKADGKQITAGENYPGFPIVPLWGNKEHQSELIGLREQIDCYDLIKNSFANDLDEASLIWTITNAGGMDEVDLALFRERLKILKAAKLDDDVQIQSHTIDVPHESREALLDRIDKDLYRDAMALNTEAIAGGAITATQIQAAYEPLNSKCDSFEYCVLDFIQKILAIAGIDDAPSFTRSMIVNVNESIQTVSQAAAYLPEDYVTRKILTLLGDGDKADEIISIRQAENIPRLNEENDE